MEYTSSERYSSNYGYIFIYYHNFCLPNYKLHLRIWKLTIIVNASPFNFFILTFNMLHIKYSKWLLQWGLWVMVFDATFNNISVILWWSVLLVEKQKKTTYLPQVCGCDLMLLIYTNKVILKLARSYSGEILI